MGHKEVPVTHLRKMMLEELQRRNYSQTTVQTYLKSVQAFAEHFHTPPDRLGLRHIREYQAYLFQEKKLAAGTVGLCTAALRFFFVKTLKRRYPLDDVPYPKRPHRLPTVLTVEEAARLINSASNLFHRAILMTLYATGVRRAELCHLKVSDIDSAQMIVHVRQGKGARDRDIPLDPKLLETLKEYWRWMHPKTYLFPGTVKNWRADKPITPKVVWEACREAAARAGITKPVRPHTMRHSFATHRLESGCDLVTLQTLLGHVNIRHTTIYLHLSQRHLRSAGNPLDTIEVSSPDQIKRSRKLHKK
jgi:site-specific recombinase XerD